MVRERREAPRKTSRKHEAKPSGTIWDTPRIRKMAAEPFGSPISLTPEEARELAVDAFGRGKGRYPDGVEYVKRVSYIWKGLVKPTDG